VDPLARRPVDFERAGSYSRGSGILGRTSPEGEVSGRLEGGSAETAPAFASPRSVGRSRPELRVTQVAASRNRLLLLAARGAPAEAGTPLSHSDPPAETGGSYASVRFRRPKPPNPSRRSRNSRQLRRWSGPPAEAGGPVNNRPKPAVRSRYRCCPEGQPDRLGDSRGLPRPESRDLPQSPPGPRGVLRSISEHL
jgi:hypothetical protein